MNPKSRRVQRALSRAVELRSIGKPLEEIAKVIKRLWPSASAVWYGRQKKITPPGEEG